MRPFLRFLFPTFAVFVVPIAGIGQEMAPNYTKDIAPFLKKYCMECHNSRTAKSGYNFETYDLLMRGNKKGKKAVIPGEPEKSLALKTLEGRAKKMPPKKNQQPDKKEIAVFRAWIAGGAKDDKVKTGWNLSPSRPEWIGLFPNLEWLSDPENKPSLTLHEPGFFLLRGFQANAFAHAEDPVTNSKEWQYHCQGS